MRGEFWASHLHLHLLPWSCTQDAHTTSVAEFAHGEEDQMILISRVSRVSERGAFWFRSEECCDCCIPCCVDGFVTAVHFVA
jgi:hypothetical protein